MNSFARELSRKIFIQFGLLLMLIDAQAIYQRCSKVRITTNRSKFNPVIIKLIVTARINQSLVNFDHCRHNYDTICF